MSAALIASTVAVTAAVGGDRASADSVSPVLVDGYDPAAVQPCPSGFAPLTFSGATHFGQGLHTTSLPGTPQRSATWAVNGNVLSVRGVTIAGVSSVVESVLIGDDVPGEAYRWTYAPAGQATEASPLVHTVGPTTALISPMAGNTTLSICAVDPNSGTRLTLRKVVVGSATSPGAFLLSADSSAAALSGTTGISAHVPSGSYSLTEASARTGDALSLRCAASTGAPLSMSGATVTLSAGAATCTFTNTAPDPRAIVGDLSSPTITDILPEGPSANDELTYTLTARNVSPAALTGVSIASPLLGPLTCTVGATPVTLPAVLDPAAALTCVGTHVVNQEEIEAGHVAVTGEFCADQAPCAAAVYDHVFGAVTPVPGITVASVTSTVGNGDATFTVGELATWQVAVTNTGATALQNVVIVDTVAAGYGIECEWPAAIGDLAPGDGATCVVSHSLTQADLDSGLLMHSNEACGDVPDGADVGTAPDATGICGSAASDLVIPAAPAASTTITGSAIVDLDTNGHDAGDRIDYTITVTNAGNTTAVLSLSAPTLGVPICEPPDSGGVALAPGATLGCTASHTVQQADVDAGRVAATVAGCAAAGALRACDPAELITPVTRRPSVATSKAATAPNYTGGRIPKAGDEISYTVLVRNTGNTTLALSATDPLIPALPCRPAAGSDVAPGGSMTCTGILAITQANVDAGQITNTATGCGAPAGLPAVCIASTAVTELPATRSVTTAMTASSVVDLDGNGPDVGDRIDYAIGVTNTGNISSGLALTSTRLATLTCAPTQGAVVAPGGSMVCSGAVVLSQADVDAGHVANNATGCVAQTNICQTAITDTPVPPVAATATSKTASAVIDLDGNGHDPGDRIHYTIAVKNTGNTTAGLTITDPLLSTLTCAPLQNTPVAPGATMTCTGSYAVVQADVDAGVRANVARGCAAATCSLASTATTIVRRPAVVAAVVTTPVIDLDKNGPDAGDAVDYRISVTNTGNVGVALSLTDSALPAKSLTCTPVQGTIAGPGGSMTCRGRRVLTQAQVNAGRLVNTAKGCGALGAAVPVCATLAHTRAVPRTPALTITTTPPLQRLASGRTASFAVTVKNSGNVDLTNIAVANPIAPLCAKAIGALVPGASSIYRCTRVTTADTVAIATVSGTGPPGASPQPVADDAAVDVTPRLAVSATASPAVAPLGGSSATATITFAIRNLSTEPVNRVTLVDNVFGNLGGLNRTGATGRQAGGALTWVITNDGCTSPRSIAAGATFACAVAVTIGVNLASLPLPSHNNIATATARDNEGNIATATDGETVTLRWSARTALTWSTRVPGVQWPTGYRPATLVQRVFTIPKCLQNARGNLDLGPRSRIGSADNLLAGLRYPGTAATVVGGAEQLLSAAIAAVLNEQRFTTAYPGANGSAELVARVNKALASCNRATMVALAGTLGYWNNAAP